MTDQRAHGDFMRQRVSAPTRLDGLLTCWVRRGWEVRGQARDRGVLTGDRQDISAVALLAAFLVSCLPLCFGFDHPDVPNLPHCGEEPCAKYAETPGREWQ